MPDLITELEQEHEEILSHLQQIRLADYQPDLAMTELQAARDKFLRHIGRDGLLVLGPMMDQSPHAGLARRFHRHMQALTRDLMAFFDRYLQAAEPNFDIEFAMELGRVTQRLRHRMQAEEARLYPLRRGGQEVALA
jgi:iron-sulfur cluster repair protein YtfE (RIC family)